MKRSKKMPNDLENRILEEAVCFGLAIEDQVISNLQYQIKNNKIPVPEQGSTLDLFIYNSGNLFNGFMYSMLADYVLNGCIEPLYNFTSKYFSQKNLINKFLNYLREDQNRINITSGILSSLAIGFFETTGIGNSPDLKDIPAGVIGALLHTTLRYLSLKKYKDKKN